MTKLTFLFILTLTFVFSHAQVYYSKNASVSFFSKTSMEDIKADNNQVLTVLNTKTGEVQFSLSVKGFHFSKPLMEEHFNENYMESEKFPKSSFKGQVEDITKVNFSKDGTYKVTVKGDLTMHGVTKNISVSGNITVDKGKVSSGSKFIVTLADFNISIPKIVQQTIQKTIEVTVASKYELKQ